jgi:hypothetical protein
MPYPFSFDTYSTKVFGEVCEAAHMNVLQDTITALQTKLGLDSSGDSTSIDYWLKSPSKLDPGHQHSSGSITSVAEAAVTRPVTPILARLTQNEIVTGAWTINSSWTIHNPWTFTGTITTVAINTSGSINVSGTNSRIAVTGGYGAVSGQAGAAGEIRIGGGGTTPNVASISVGTGAGRLNLGYESAGTFYTGFTFDPSGKLGIGTFDPSAGVHFGNFATNRRIVFWDSVGAPGNDHQFFGFGLGSGTLRVQVDSTTTGGVSIFAGESSIKSQERFRFLGDGRLVISDIADLSLLSGIPATSAVGLFTLLTASAGSVGDGSRSLNIEQYRDAATNGPQLSLRRSRGTISAHTPLLSTDNIGTIRFQGQSSTNPTTPDWTPCAAIDAVASANFSSGTSKPARLSFLTKEWPSGGANMDGTLTEKVRITPEGHLVIAPGGANPQRGSSTDGSSASYGSQCILSISGYGNTATACGCLEFWNPAGDIAGKAMGHIAWVDTNLAATDKLSAYIIATTAGGTATNRGSTMSFATKVNGAGFRTAMDITSDQQLMIYNANAVPSTPIGGGCLFVVSGALWWMGTSGVGQMIKSA